MSRSVETDRQVVDFRSSLQTVTRTRADTVNTSGVLLDVFSQSLATRAPPSVRLRSATRAALDRLAPAWRTARLVAAQQSGREPAESFGLDLTSARHPAPPLPRAYSLATQEPARKVWDEFDRGREPGGNTQHESYLSESFGEERFGRSGILKQTLAPLGIVDLWRAERRLEGGAVIGLLLPRFEGEEKLTADQRNALLTLTEVLAPTFASEGKQIERVLQSVGGNHRLSKPQLRVLRGLAFGLSNAEIATECNRSPHTVNSHLRELYRRFGVSSRSELIAKSRGRADP